MRVKFNRVISLFLTMLLFISLLPTSTFVYGEDVPSYGNITAGGTVEIKPNGQAGSVKWDSNLNAMTGYKISVWYAPIDLEKTKDKENPVYQWGSGEFQVGINVYWRDLFIKDEYGKPVAPAKWGKSNIYGMTVRGQSWNDNKANARLDFFRYLAMEYFRSKQYRDLKGNPDFYTKSLSHVKALSEYLNPDGKNENNGQKALRDWINRIYDMENPTNPNIESGAKIRTVNDLRLPFAPATRSKSGDGVIKSAEYIKSYFMNPTILNEMAYSTRPQGAEGGEWNVYDFIVGRLRGNSKDGFQYKQGQYKIFIEPVMFRPYNGVLGVMSWREMMAEYNEAGSDKRYTAISNVGIAICQIANALRIQVTDPVLNINGKPLTASTPDMKGDFDSPVALSKDSLNGLGVGIITSPSLSSYAPVGPDILRTYVMVTSVDADGTVHYKKAAESTLERANFRIAEDGNTTQIPVFEEIEGAEGGTALLNDIITTDKDLSLNENTEWVDTLLPENIGVDLKPTSEDIAGYATGLITGSELFIDTYSEAILVDDSVIASLKAVREIYNALEESNAGVANETTTIMTSPLAKFSRNENAPATVVIKVVDAIPYVYFGQVKLGKIVDGRVEKIVDETADKTDGLGVVTPANNLILRYILKPTPSQIDTVELRNSETDEVLGVLVGSPQDLMISGDVVTVQQPNIDNLEKWGKPEMESWVTNEEYPLKDITSGILPPISPNGISGETSEITGYPQEPLVHNLYVKWVIRVISPTPILGEEVDYHVPEWRLSKLFVEDKVIDGPTAMVLPITYGHCNLAKLTPSGNWNYTTRNPNGKTTLPGHNPLNLRFDSEELSWIHAETVKTISTDTVGAYKPTATVTVDGRINAIKSTNTSGLKVVNWLDSGSIEGLKPYSVQADVKGSTFNQKEYKKSTELHFKTLNLDTYTNTWPNAHYHKGGGHCHRWVNSKTIAPLNASYIPYRYNTLVDFDRYVQQNTDSKKLVVQPEVKNESGMTSIKYQLNNTLNIYPEYGMLFANDAGKESIKWVVGDQARKISPVVYQTLQHKVYVVPNSNGTSYATDSRAITQANALGEGKKQVIYKGAGVNTAFQLYRDSEKKNKALLTVKTYALDFRNDESYKDVKSSWGNTDYNSYKEHESLLNSINTKKTADATEKLLVDSPAFNSVDYTGATKSLKTGSYNLIKYSKNNMNNVIEIIILFSLKWTDIFLLIFNFLYQFFGKYHFSF